MHGDKPAQTQKDASQKTSQSLNPKKLSFARGKKWKSPTKDFS